MQTNSIRDDLDETPNAAENEQHSVDDVVDRLNFSKRKKLPIIRQIEAAECSLACLAMIMEYHGDGTGLSALRRKFPLSQNGTNLKNVIAIAQQVGLSARAVRLELNELTKLDVPCILHWDLNHFVVLREIKKQTVIIHDPASGERSLTMKDVSRHFSGVALEVSRGPTFQRAPTAPPISLLSLAGSVKGFMPALAQIFGLALILELFGLLMPQFVRLVVDQVLAGRDYDLMVVVGISFAMLLLIHTAVSALRSWIVMWLGYTFSMNWMGNVFQHLIRLPQSYFLKRHLGDVVSRFGSIGVIQHTLTTGFIEVVLDGLMATLTLAMLFAYSPSLAAIILSVVAIYTGLRLLYFHSLREANINQIEAEAKQQSGFLEAIRGVQTIRVFTHKSVI